MLLADDYGWANVGYHRTESNSTTREVDTPNIDSLVKSGIELDRNYVFKFCSPTRSSLQSGRLPVHVNVENAAPDVSNPANPVSGFAAIPRNMTGMASKMKLGGYKTHQIGKWDAGMATPDHTPHGRGYDTSFGYFHHANNYWTEETGSCASGATYNEATRGWDVPVDGQKGGHPVVDMWIAEPNGTEHPAHGHNGSMPISTDPKHVPVGVNGSIVDYEEWKFGQYALKVINEHDPTDPLFLCYCFHIVHEPLHVPRPFFDRQEHLLEYPDFQFHRTIYHAMVKFMDDVVLNVTTALKTKDMYQDTLIVFSSDNGGPSFSGSSHTANNFPHRGSKMSDWEGGTRVNGFVSGGFLQRVAPLMVGAKLEGLTHICDWYTTFSALAGVEARDDRAAAANLPPVDGLNLWPYLSGQVQKSPRTEIHMDTAAFISGQFKLLTGDHHAACWMGPHYPNGTMDPGCNTTEHCGDGGCLYNIYQDPTEHHNLAADSAYADTLKSLQAKLIDANTRFFSPNRGKTDPRACKVAKANGNFWGPFVP
jgi:arylsulfatase I/J